MDAGNEHAETPVTAPEVPAEENEQQAPVEGPGAKVSEDQDQAPDGEAAEADEDEQEPAHGAKFTPEQQAAFDKAMQRKQRKVREARERAEKAEAELAKLQAENQELGQKVGDEAVLAAMQSAGVLPEYVKPDEAKLVAEAEGLKSQRRWLNRLVRAGEEYTGTDAQGNERTWTVAQLATSLDQVEERLERIGGRSEAIKARVVEEYRQDYRTGREQRLKGGGGASAPAAAPRPAARPARPAADISPPPPPAGGGERRQDPTRGEAKPTVDWSKVQGREDLEKAMLEEERAKARR